MRIFTKLLVTAILPAILLVCMLPQQAIPQSRANFWFLNNSGKTLNNLYVSPHSANSWGTDVLGRAALPDGMGTLIVFPPQWRGVCHEDFKLVFSDGTAEQYHAGHRCMPTACSAIRRDHGFGILKGSGKFGFVGPMISARSWGQRVCARYVPKGRRCTNCANG